LVRIGKTTKERKETFSRIREKQNQNIAFERSQGELLGIAVDFAELR